MMKKMLIAMGLVLALMMPAAAVGTAQSIQGTSATVMGMKDPKFDGPSFNGTVPAEAETIPGMLPPLNALVMAMMEQDMVYRENDDVFFWNSLYYMLSLYGSMDGRAELTQDTLTLPSETVQDYAAAMFSNYRGLPDMPQGMKTSIAYDEEMDLYHLGRGDAALNEVAVTEVIENQDGSLTVRGAMVALVDGRDLCQFTSVMQPNNGMFGYTISDLKIL